MALIKCPECGGTVSSLASVCPHCGNPMSSPSVPPTESMPTTVITKAPDPEPGEKMQDQAAALRTLLENSRTDNTFTSPLSDPQERAEISAFSIGKILMILLAIGSIVFESIYCTRYGNMSPTLLKAIIGYQMSFLGLFFMTKMLNTEEWSAQNFLGFWGVGLALLITIVDITKIIPGAENMGYDSYYGYYSVPNLFWFKSLEYFSIALGFLIIILAGTIRNYSKYLMMTAGVLWVITASADHISMPFAGSIVDRVPTTAFIILGVIGGLCLFSMLVNWIVEASSSDNHPLTRMAAAIEAMLILATIIIVAVSLKDIISVNSYDDNTYLKRFSSVKLSMIFMMITGISSLFVSLKTSNKFQYVVSAVFTTLAIFIMLGLYLHFFVGYGDGVMRNLSNIDKAACFFIPISIMTYYFAELTGSFKGKITINIQ